MTHIGLISDTHGYLDQQVLEHFKNCHEIWHAGDFGNITIAEKLKSVKPLKGVYGNVDGYDVRSVYPEKIIWKCEDVNVFMIHIGGHPGRYAPGKKRISDRAKHKRTLLFYVLALLIILASIPWPFREIGAGSHWY